MIDMITAPFSLLLRTLAEWMDSYGFALLAFALIITLIRVPFDIKSKRGGIGTALIQPKVKALQEKYADDKMKLHAETQKLYKEEGVKPMGGCIWNLLPMVIILMLFWIVREPLTHLMSLDEAQVETLRAALEGMGYEIQSGGFYQVQMAGYIRGNFEYLHSLVPEIFDINMNFLGLNIGRTPEPLFFNQPDWGIQDLVLFLLPVFSAVSLFFQQKITQATSYQQMAQQAQMMKTMMFIMPIFSLFIGFSFPAAMSVYWIASGLSLTLVSIFTNLHFKKVYQTMQAEMEERDRQKQAVLEEKRRKTQERKALGLTEENKGTSKKKKQQQEREKERQRLAAKRAEEREDDEEENLNPSRVAHRKFARGRAYNPERYEREEDEEQPDTDLDTDEPDTPEYEPPVEAADDGDDAYDADDYDDEDDWDDDEK